MRYGSEYIGLVCERDVMTFIIAGGGGGQEHNGPDICDGIKFIYIVTLIRDYVDRETR